MYHALQKIKDEKEILKIGEKGKKDSKENDIKTSREDPTYI